MENIDYENLNGNLDIDDELKKDEMDIEINLDFENIFETNEDNSSEVKIDSPSDGLILSLSNLGKVDLNYISKITDMSIPNIIEELKGSIYQNPLTWEEDISKGWETKEEYLSGNLRKKYKDAIEANNTYPGVFDYNIKTIKEITNDDPCVAINDIYFTLGSPWIPVSIVENFILDLLCSNSSGTNWSIEVRHDKISGTWSVHVNGTAYKYNYLYDKYSTRRIDVFKIIEKTLNQTPLIIKDKSDRSKTGIKNEEETFSALEKQKLIVEKFKEWVLDNDEVIEELTNCYNELYCHNHRRIFSGAFLKFPNMSRKIQLFDYQKDAVARIIFSKNVLLAHDVGSGKTYEMIAAGQELIRMNLSKKNMYVVPNGIIKQWENIYKEMYPDANILVVTSKNFKPNTRNEILKDIRDNTYDGIIITYSSFSLIPLSPDYYKNQIEEDYSLKQDATKKRITNTKYISRSVSNIDAHKEKLVKVGTRLDDTIYFDDLGIDRLFVDEAHNFKNVTLGSNIQALGINNIGSKKCDEMMDKVFYIQKTHNGGGVVFATGTPITNSISDLYVIQKYLQYGELQLLNLSNFNAWIANYAELESNFEISVETTKFKMAQRYSKFHNIPELSSIFANIVDFHHIDQKEDIPEFNGYIDIVTNPNSRFIEFLKDISSRADEIRHHKPRILKEGTSQVDPVKDNMLVITSDGRKGALDLRLVDKGAGYNDDYKVNICARNVYDIYKKTEDFKGTQLVFCDVSTPKTTFNVYTEMKSKLINLGMDVDEVQFIHDYDSPLKREQILKKVREGKVRVLLGSTFKLGTGVNVQDKLYAIHHLDVPWRPSDMIQRNGRILRYGNNNKEVFIYRYILKNSFDAYSWQLLETKQNFIHKLLNNSVFFRDASDIDDVTLNYAEVKALAIGEPLIKKRVELFNELQNLKKIKFKNIEYKERIRRNLCYLDDIIPELKKKIENAELDLEYFNSLDFNSMSEEDKKIFREDIYMKLIDHQYEEDTVIGEYFGYSIIAPKFQTSEDEKISFYLEKNGKYLLKIGKSSISIIRRIDKFLLGLNDYIFELQVKLDSHLDYIKKANIELAKEDNIVEKIDIIQNKLDKVDKELGVS